MWFEIMVNLFDYMEAGLSADDIPVGMGPAAGEDRFPCVRLIRNGEPAPRKPQSTAGDCKIFIDACVRNDDPDARAAYTQLSAIEKKVLGLIPGWQKQLGKTLGIAADVTIDETMSDEGLLYPVYESRTILGISWRQ